LIFSNWNLFDICFLGFGIFYKHSPEPTNENINCFENPSTTLRTSLSQPEPIAIMGCFQNVPPDDNNSAHQWDTLKCTLKKHIIPFMFRHSLTRYLKNKGFLV